VTCSRFRGRLATNGFDDGATNAPLRRSRDVRSDSRPQLRRSSSVGSCLRRNSSHCGDRCRFGNECKRSGPTRNGPPLVRLARF
jgi:hypothetical protein